MVRSFRVRTGTGLPGQRPLDSATRWPCFSEAARGRELPGCGAVGGPGMSPSSLSLLPWLPPQGSGHNVSQEALAIKRMLEIGAVKNLTYF